jgi:hypothetical protein
MEKKGEILNQLAIITDLIEKINIDIKSSTIIYEINENEFLKLYDIIEKKFGFTNMKPENTFNIKIGSVIINFNKSSV